MALLRYLAIACMAALSALPSGPARAAGGVLGTNYVLSTLQGTNRTFAIGNDTFTLAGTCAATNAVTACNNANEVVDVTVRRGVVSVLFSNSTAGGTTPLLDDSLTTAAASLTGITITVTQTGVPAYELITSVNTVTTGTMPTGSTGNGTYVFTSATGRQYNGQANLVDALTAANPTQTSTATSATGAGNWSVAPTWNIATGDGSTANILTALLTFTKAPEPATIGLMVMGIGGLAAARRRRRV